jgi:two-component system nitrate/nitrite response regulator NarL
MSQPAAIKFMIQPAAIRVVLVESQRLVREALRSLLQATGEIVVIGEAAAAQDLFGAIESHRPDVALLSVDPRNDRDSGLQELPELSHRVPTLVLISDGDARLHTWVIQHGAFGIVSKSHSGELLVKAVRKVRAGELWLDRARTADVVNRLTNTYRKDDPEARKMATLTPRERQIVALVANGLKNKTIAQQLSISEATARNHLTSILNKLELSNRFQLAVFAFRQGLISCPQMPSLMKRYSPAGTYAAGEVGPSSRAADRQNSTQND